MGNDGDAGPAAGAAWRIELPADPGALSEARGKLERWLDALSWPAEDAADVSLAVSEALTNAIEHGYADTRGGTVSVHVVEYAEGDRRRLSVVVRDRGCWLHRDRPQEGRGFGLPMMRELMAAVEVEHEGAGTTVAMVSRAAPRRDGLSTKAEIDSEEWRL